MDDPNDALREFQRAEETRRAAAAWLQAFEAALGSRDAGRIAALFQADAHWRDVLAFTWNFSAAAGRDEIAARLQGWLDEHGGEEGDKLIIMHGMSSRVLRGMLSGMDVDPRWNAPIAPSLSQGSIVMIEGGVESIVHLGAGHAPA